MHKLLPLIPCFSALASVAAAEVYMNVLAGRYNPGRQFFKSDFPGIFARQESDGDEFTRPIMPCSTVPGDYKHCGIEGICFEADTVCCNSFMTCNKGFYCSGQYCCCKEGYECDDACIELPKEGETTVPETVTNTLTKPPPIPSSITIPTITYKPPTREVTSEPVVTRPDVDTTSVTKRPDVETTPGVTREPVPTDDITITLTRSRDDSPVPTSLPPSIVTITSSRTKPPQQQTEEPPPAQTIIQTTVIYTSSSDKGPVVVTKTIGDLPVPANPTNKGGAYATTIIIINQDGGSGGGGGGGGGGVVTLYPQQTSRPRPGGGSEDGITTVIYMQVGPSGTNYVTEILPYPTIDLGPTTTPEPQLVSAATRGVASSVLLGLAFAAFGMGIILL